MVAGISFENIVLNLKDIQVEYAGMTAGVRYKPSAITPKFRKLIGGGDPSVEVAIEATKRLVAEWEITRDGAMWPLTDEALGDMPYDLLNAVIGGIMDDFNAPDPPAPATRAKTSVAG